MIILDLLLFALMVLIWMVCWPTIVVSILFGVLFLWALIKIAFSWLSLDRKISNGPKPIPQESTAKTHDYTKRGWGHDFTITTVIDRVKQLKASGWGYGIRCGDFLLLPNKLGITRYRVININYYSNPADMWNADLSFAPR